MSQYVLQSKDGRSEASESSHPANMLLRPSYTEHEATGSSFCQSPLLHRILGGAPLPSQTWTTHWTSAPIETDGFWERPSTSGAQLWPMDAFLVASSPYWNLVQWSRSLDPPPIVPVSSVWMESEDLRMLAIFDVPARMLWALRSCSENAHRCRQFASLQHDDG